MGRVKEAAVSIKEIRMSTGLSQRKFCEALGIPTRTLEDWERGVSRCPAYVEALIAYRVEHDPALRKEQKGTAADR